MKKKQKTKPAQKPKVIAKTKKTAPTAKLGYNHLKIEPKWQKFWASKLALYKAIDNDDKREKLFMLVEFPFPSGAGLHAGHVRSYTALDIIARKNRMMGKNVLYPIGWDAFGLPTENYAIKTGLQPSVVTKQNTKNFERQLRSLGFSFDWTRTVDTTDPEYFKWTQWIFLQFLKAGLAYRDKISINWCPKDKIGLANEEVVAGCCERCGTKVEKRIKEQWMLAITKYADRLDKDLDLVDYPERVKTQQRNWIGKSEGAEVDFAVEVAGAAPVVWPEKKIERKITVFTTRPDTLFGVTFVVLAPEHALLQELKSYITNWDTASTYIQSVASIDEAERTSADKEKTGVRLEGVYAVHPVTGQKIEIWIADYVLATYGTGAVMGVPAHDERDNLFAKKYSIEIKTVIDESTGLLIDSGEFTGSRSEIASKLIAHKHGTPTTKYKLRDWVFSRQRYWGEPIPVVYCACCYADKQVNPGFKKEDISINFYNKVIWDDLVSGAKSIETRALNPEERDRYFGDIKPGQIIKCVPRFTTNAKGAKKAVQTKEVYFVVEAVSKYSNLDELFANKKDLRQIFGSRPVPTSLTAFKKSYESLADGYAKRADSNGIVAWTLKKLTATVPVPEKDLPLTLPKVKKYEPTDTGESPLAAISSWVNTTCPNCKSPATRETDTMPNWAGSSWYYLRYADPKNKKAFADPKKLAYWTPVNWYNGGMEHTTLHLLYSRFWHKFLFDQKHVPTTEPYAKRTSHGLIMAGDGTKMSKSKGNVVNPDEIVKLYGADTLRLFEMFIGPFEQAVAWNSEGLIGPRRFIERVYRLADKIQSKSDERKSPVKLSSDSYSLLHRTIKKVGEDIDSLAMNTAVSSLMILINQLEKEPAIPRVDFIAVLSILAPFIPFVAEEIHERIGGKGSVTVLPWPTYDTSALQNLESKVVVQINGKLRATITLSSEEAHNQDLVTQKALALPEIVSRIGDKSPTKVIFVSGKLINFVFVGL